MNEAASSVEPEVKTRFATVDDAAFERPQMQFPVFINCSNLTIDYNFLSFFLSFFLSSGMTRRSFMSAHSYVLRQDSGKNIIYTRTH